MQAVAEEAAPERAEREPAARAELEERVEPADADSAQAALEGLCRELKESAAVREALEPKLRAPAAELAALRSQREAWPDANSGSAAADSSAAAALAAAEAEAARAGAGAALAKEQQALLEKELRLLRHEALAAREAKAAHESAAERKLAALCHETSPSAENVPGHSEGRV